MASENEASCESDPNFAVICGFLEKFSVTCGVANIDFVDLQEMLENTQEVSPELVQLHVQLMRRARRSVPSNDRWERALIKTCHTFSNQDAWEIERFGYKKARISSKLRILKELLEMQFDYNQKFKNEINKISAVELRTQPLGRDQFGRAYWYQCDERCQIRVYKEDPDDETWTLIAKDRKGLVSLISQLGNGDTTKSSSEPVSNEDSNSLEVEKPTLDTGQSENSSPKPTEPDTSDNMQEEKMDIDTECTESHKNIEVTKLQETNSPSLPANDERKVEEKAADFEKDIEEKVVENEKKIQEKVVETESKIEEKVVEIEEEVVEMEKKIEEKVVEIERKIEEKEKVVEIPEKIKAVEVKPPDNSKPEIIEDPVVENEDTLAEGNALEDNSEKLPDIEEKLPIEEDSCENALNLCSKDLSNKQDSEEEKTGLDLSVKTGPCLRIKPITELMAEPQHSDLQKKEFMGIKGKYIRGDAMDKGLLYPNPTHLGKAVQSASYDAICYKRAMEDDIYSAPSNLKHPRFDKRGCMRPTLLANKKYIPYNMDDDDDYDDLDDEDDMEDEIEEPLMLVQGEGSGFPNESANEKLEENPIVGEEVEEPVFYVFGEGAGKDCKTGNECLKKSPESKEKEAEDDANSSTKTQQLSPSKSYKLGTIIDSKNDKVTSRNTPRKSRWDVIEIPTENRNNTNENCIHDSKSDVNDVEVTADSPKNLCTSPQTFFFGNRSSFSPTSSPNKSASLSFGASTVNDNQDVDKAPSISSSKEEEEEVEEDYEKVVESSAAVTFNLDDKTDENLVGGNPSQTKVPEENVDIENVDNNMDVSERLPVVENEKRDGSEEESVSISEHERVSCDKSATVTDVSDSKLSEIKEDSVEANSVNACVTSDCTKDKAESQNSAGSNSVSDSDSAKADEDIPAVVASDEGSSGESLAVKNLVNIEKNQNLTAAVIPKDDEAQVIKSPENIELTIEKSQSAEVDEKQPSSILETESNPEEKCEPSKSSKDDEEQNQNSDVTDFPNSCSEDHEVANELKSDSCKSKVEDEVEPIRDKKEKNEEKPVDTPKRKDQIPNLIVTDDVTTENDKDASNVIEETPLKKNSDANTEETVIEETPLKKNSDADTEETVKIVHSNSEDVKLLNDSGDTNKDQSKYSKHSNTAVKSNEDKAPNEAAKGVEETTAEPSNVIKSAQQSEVVENNNLEENNDLSVEENKIKDVLNIENSKKDKDEIITDDLKPPNKLENHKPLDDESVEIEETKSQTAASSAEDKTESDLKDAVTIADTPSDKASNECEENSRKIDSKERIEEAKTLPESQKKFKSKNNETKEKTNLRNLRSGQKINNFIERKEPVNKKANSSEPISEEIHISDSDTSSEMKNEKKSKRKKEDIKDKNKEQPKDPIDDKAIKETTNKISRDLYPIVVLSQMSDKEFLVDDVENDDDVASKSGLEAIKAIKITSVQAKYNMPDKASDNKDKFPIITEKKQIKPPEPQSLRFLRCRRPNQMLSVKSYATRNKNLVLRKETKPQIETNGKNVNKPKIENIKPQKEQQLLPNNIDEHLAIAKIEEHVENNVRRSTRRKPADLIEKVPVIPPPQPKGRQKKVPQIPQEIKRIDEVDVRHSKRLRLSNNQIPITNVETIDLTSESDSKHSVKRNPLARRSDEVHLKGGLSIKAIYKQPEREEKKPAKKNGPFLTCVNIKKLKENPLDIVDSPLSVESSGGGDNSDVVIIEDDPLAVPDPFETSNMKPMTLSSFQLDVDYPSPPPIIMTRSLRKRAIAEPEVIVPTGGKRRKTKVKRQVDLELRRSIEEQKKQEISSSDEEKKEVSPKRKPQLHKPKKQEPQINVIPAAPPVKKPRAPKKKTLLGLDIPAAMEELDATLGNIRQSRRIAQLKIREEAERRKIDDITMTDDKEPKKKNKKNIDKDYKAEKRKRPKPPPIEEVVAVEIPIVEVEEKKKKRKRKHKDPRKIFDESNPWRSSSGSSSSNDDVEEEEEEIAEYSEAESPLFRSDHEFSPESDIEDTGEPQPLKRARTARKEDDIEDVVDEHACQKCGKSDHPEWILLCDTCDNGWHCSCLRPPLFIIPEGDWFCPPCQHNSLVKQLESKLDEYDKKLAKREIEVRRKERLAYVGISLANVLPVKDVDEKRKRRGRPRKDDYEDDLSASEESYSSSESSSSSDSDEPIYQLRQRRQAHSYRFNDYDDLINSAIQDEMEAVKGAGNQGRGKDISTIVNAEKEDGHEANKKLELEPLPPVVPVETKELPPVVVPPEHNDGSEDEKIKPVKKLFGRKKQRKLNSLDVSSGDDQESDEDFKGSSSEEEEEEFEEDVGSDSSEAYGRRRRGMAVRRSTRARTSRYDKDFIDDDSDDDRVSRKKKSRSAWDEESESEESDKSWGRTSRRKTKRYPVPPRKKRSKKSKKHFDDSEDDRSKKKKRRIKYGGLNDDDDDDEIGGRRTRGKKINYADVLASDSDEEVKKRAPPRIESDDDYVANEDQEEPDEDEYEKEEENAEKEKTPERNEIDKEKEKTPEREISVPKEPEETIPEPQPTNAAPAEELSSEVPVNSDPPDENFDLDNLNSSIDDLPDDMPDDNDEDDSELNPIEEINKNLEEMDEAEMEKLMEEEEYANKQLQLMAMQLEKEKKRREREAKKKEMTAVAGLDTKLPKKRGRKNKPEYVPPVAAFQLGSDTQSNPEVSEPPAVAVPIFSEIPPSSVDGSPKKRRGRGKGKKTLEKEQAAAAAAMVGTSSSMPPSSISSEASDDQSHIPTTLEAVGSTNNAELSLASAAAMHGAKLAIAAPPQPFSQTQPTPSVITRMMQGQTGQGNYSPMGMGHNYYADQPPAHVENSPTPPAANSQMSACVPLSGNVNANNPGQIPPISQPQYLHGNSPRGMSSTVYRQPPPSINPYHRTSPAPPIRARNPNPTPPSSIPPVYHSHHLDPSPSGGGPISVSTSSMNNTPDRSSPVSIPPSSDSPLSNKSDPTPPPPPYSRSTQIRFGGNVATTPPMASSPIRQQQNILPPQHLQQQPGPPRNNMPYHPANVPPNFYAGYMPGNIGSEESLTPTGYHYSDQFSETNSPQDLGKGYDEENSGEFGGLVSYFSSQREDDLDT